MATKRVSDTWESGSPYELYVGRWSRKVAPEFLAWLAQPPGKKWVDLGCGTGALSAAIVDHCAPASVTGVEPSEGFLKTAKANLGNKVTLHQGGAAAIPLRDGSADVIVSGLVLNFVPDQRAAMAEMRRVVGRGGIIAAYVWDYAGKMELMRYFWDSAVALDPAARQMDEGLRFPLCHPKALEALFNGAGTKDVETKAIDIPTVFENFDDYWQPFLGGQGPAPSYAMALDETARNRLRERLKQQLPVGKAGSIPMLARAWAVRGVVA